MPSTEFHSAARRIRRLNVSLLLALLRCIDASAAEVPAGEIVRQEQPAFLVRAWLDHENGSYREGESIVLKVVAEKDAYLYVLYQQADDRIYQIFPNAAHPDNFVNGRSAVELGGRDDLFRWEVGPPFGDEKITVIAACEPITEMSQKEQIARQFNPVSETLLKAIQLEIDDAPPDRWAVHQVALATKPKDAPPDPSAGKRIGLCIGISRHMFAEEELELIGTSPDLPCPRRAAEEIGHLMKTTGQVDQVVVLTDEGATRQNIEQAITRWLPDVSAAGDTVFIFYCGHTSQFEDDNGDEQDKLDEWMMPHDIVGHVATLWKAAQRYEQGQVTGAKLKRLRSWPSW